MSWQGGKLRAVREDQGRAVRQARPARTAPGAMPLTMLSQAEIEKAVNGADLIDALLYFARLHDRPVTGAKLTTGLPRGEKGLALDLMGRAARRADLHVRLRRNFAFKRFSEAVLPAMLVLRDGRVCILLDISGGGQARMVFPELPEREVTMTAGQLEALYAGIAGFATPEQRSDERSSDYVVGQKRHWFWSRIAAYKWHFAEVAFAAGLANLLAIATSLYMRQIYDRVVPNLAFSTLWVLTIGVAIAITMEMIVRIVRAFLMDATGKELDQLMSRDVFAQAMGMRLDTRPKSTGSFVNQVREFDAVREFFTSSTIGTLTDIPFAFLFILVIWLLGGPVAFVLLAAVPLIVIPGLLAQWPLARYAEAHMKEGSIRNGLLVEAMTSAETVKAIEGEGRFQRLWEEYTWLLAKNGMRMRQLTATLGFSAGAVQQFAYVMVIVVGVYQIFKGEMTVGSMMACSILSSRALAPMTQLAGIFSRYQQMRTALSGIDRIMAAPVERQPSRAYVSRPNLTGHFKFDNLTFTYEENMEPALQTGALEVMPGIGTALLGANGSGKTTLLKVMAGLYYGQQGSLLVDGADIRQIEPQDLRRAVGYLPQETRLFYGSLRDNLLLGLEERDDAELIAALAFCGSEHFVNEHPMGLDRMIGEGGIGVSGGQRQSVGLARLWLRDPPIVLLDEPTSAMDHALETRVLENLAQWAKGRTMVIATHRQSALALVENAIVMQRGRPVAKGRVDTVLAGLSAPPSGQSGGE